MMTLGKKAFISTVIICVLLIFGIQSVEITVANPFFMYKYVDPPSGTIPPNIVVINPQNNTAYSSSNIFFNFIVNNAITPSTNRVGICRVNYTLQNQQKMLYIFPNWTQSNTADLIHPGLQHFNYSDTFSLADGNYTLVIDSSAMGFPGGSTPTIFNINNEATVYFSVNTLPTPTALTSSAPEFTVKAENGSVLFTINYPQSHSLNDSALYPFFNIRFKDHFSEDNWANLYNYQPQFVVGYPGFPESTQALIPSGQHTEFSYQANFPSNSQVDFQVDLLLYNLAVVVPPDGNSTPAPQNYKYEYTLVETSDWSATQTVAILRSSYSAYPAQQPTTEPSQTPNSTQENFTPILIIAVLLVAVVVVSLLVYFSKRKKGTAMSKKTFMATMIITAFLVSAVAGLQVVKVARANPLPYYFTPNHDEPVLIVETPQNYTTLNVSSILLSFTVIRPSSWYTTTRTLFHMPPFGTISNVTISLNGKEKYYDAFPKDFVNGTNGWRESYSIYIEPLDFGLNTLKINVTAYTYYVSQDYYEKEPNYQYIYQYPMNVTDTIYLNSSDASSSPTPSPSPVPTSTLALTASLSESASALNFGNTINFSVSVEGGRAPYTYAWYIDVKLVENSTSPYYATDSQPVGSHHIYVEVRDADNNTAKTLSPEFNVLPSLTYMPSSSVSPTQHPTTESTPPEPGPDGPSPFPIALVLLPIIALAAVIVFLLYYRKRR